MNNTITVEPITRIEGHGKITLHLDDNGQVQDARLHVTQFRGFEKFTEGRPYYEMPSITARICGICPVSHCMASAKACDALLSVQIPETGHNLRHIVHLAQFVQSHALSFFYLSSPDLLLGMDTPAGSRNIIGVVEADPATAKDGVLLRKLGQQIIQWLGDKRVHTAWVVPGGVNAPLKEEHRSEILRQIPDAIKITQNTILKFKTKLNGFKAEIDSFSHLPTLYVGLVSSQGEMAIYDGFLRVVDTKGKILVDKLPANKYQEIIGEAVESWSYMKFPYYKPLGYKEGIYRVGPAARLNVIDRCGTPLADKEWKEYRQLDKPVISSAFYNHYARLIEILYSLEKIEILLQDANILSTHTRATASPNNMEGVGIIEAPRGTLIHHYKIHENGLMKWANLIVATGHNNLAMNKGLLQVAKQFIEGKKINEGMLNRMEAMIRTFDPCLSCATHAMGQMPLSVEIHDAKGSVQEVLDRK